VAEAVGLHGQGGAGDQHRRRPATGGVRSVERGTHLVEVASRHVEHDRRSGVVLAGVDAVALAGDEGVDGEDGESTGHGDDGDDRPGLSSPSHLEEGHTGGETTTTQPPPPPGARRGAGEVSEQQPGQQRQEGRPSQGERPPQAAGDEGEDAGADRGDQEGVERTERPTHRLHASAPRQAVHRLASDAYGGRDRRQDEHDHGQQHRDHELGTDLERRRPGPQLAGECPTEKGGNGARHHARQEDGKELDQQQTDGTAGPSATQPGNGDLPASLLGGGRENEPEDEQGQDHHRCHQERHGAVGLVRLRPDLFGEVAQAGEDLDVGTLTRGFGGHLADPGAEGQDLVDAAQRRTHQGTGL
jgi:hypothetical protein